MRRTVKTYSILLSVLFFSLMTYVFMNDLFHYYTAPGISIFENRYLARKPIWTINRADPYPKMYENYFNDHFPYRFDLFDFNAGIINYSILRKSPYPNKVNIGKDNWLFFEKEMPGYKGSFMIDSIHVAAVAEAIHQRADFFRKKGIKFYYIIPLTKQEFYPEYLPSRIFRSPTGTVTDKIIAKIKQDTSIPFIDLRPAMLEAKKRGPKLYYKTDTHWNSWGAYFAYLEVMKHMCRDFPQLKPIAESDFTISYPKIKGKNLVEVMNLTNYISDEDVVISVNNSIAKTGPLKDYPKHPNSNFPAEYVRYTGDTTKPTLMVISDSFVFSIMPFFDEGFNKTVYIYDTGFYGTNENIINDVRPDLVLMIMYEPHLMSLIGMDY